MVRTIPLGRIKRMKLLHLALALLQTGCGAVHSRGPIVVGKDLLEI